MKFGSGTRVRCAPRHEFVHRVGGFTLVELIVVMIVAGILAAVAIPKIGSQTFRDVAYKDQIKSVLEYARKSAVVRRRFTCVNIETNGSLSMSA